MSALLDSRVWWRVVALLATLLVSGWLAVKLWPVALLVLIALLLMMALLPLVELLVRARVPRVLAVVGIVSLLIAGTVALIALLVPSLVEEFREVNDNLPEYAVKIEDLLAGAGLEVELSDQAEDFDVGEVASGQVNIVSGQKALTLVLAVISGIVMMAYMLVEAPTIGRFFGRFMDAEKQREASRLFTSMCTAVGGYFRGQLITSTAIGLFTFGLLQVLGVRNALAFAVIAAIADAVPLVGVFVAILPPFAAALQESSTTAFIVLGALLAYQQFEDRVLVPVVYGRTLNISPLVVLISVLIGAQLLGIMGVLLALPMAAIGRVLVDYWLERRGSTEPSEQKAAAESTAVAKTAADESSLVAAHGALSFTILGLRIRVIANRVRDQESPRSL